MNDMALRATKLVIEVNVRYRSDHISPDEIVGDVREWLVQTGVQEQKPLRLVSGSTYWANSIKVAIDANAEEKDEFADWLWEHANHTLETFGDLPPAMQNGFRREFEQAF